ncbi:MAG: prolipoprotein diacylglyceryl transferase [Actinobacteria bacterium]|nr:MAG: prolipoprotein diacylglyceryl transferase [Actinomycetota bacterium]
MPRQGRLLRDHGKAVIPDLHSHPDLWGVRPVLFTIGGQPVATYSFFVTLGLVVAVLLYRYNTKGKSVGNNGLYIALAATVGGIIGAKLPIWIVSLPQILADPLQPAVWLSGRTIVGGIIGGVLAVWLVKRKLGIKQRLGNYLVPSLTAGIFFGRLGCFFAGCCYGVATSLPWGVNFGDGVLRNPTQLYEAVFVLGLFVFAQLMKDRFAPGELFRLFMITYFGWRFLIEFIRVNPVWMMGLTYYQVVSLGVVIAYVLKGVYRKAASSAGGGS